MRIKAKTLITVLIAEFVLIILSMALKTLHIGGSIAQWLYLIAGVGLFISILMLIVYVVMSLEEIRNANKNINA